MSNSNSQNLNQNFNLSNSILSNHQTIPKMTTPGYVASDPMNNYQHICDSCRIKKVDNKPSVSNRNKSIGASFPAGQPQPYDPHNHITHYLNACFDAPDVYRCHLEPNNRN